MKKYILLLIVIVLTIQLHANSRNDTIDNPDTLTTIIPDTHVFQIDTNDYGNVIIKDSQILDMLDSLVNISYFTDQAFITDTNLLNRYNFPPGHVPSYPDSILGKRIATLNLQTPIELVMNRNVKSYIHLYAVKKRELTSRMLGLAELYFPMIEEQLDKYDIPLEMKYLAVVESALNPTAGSRAGAKGLWQFMYGTGKVYGLKVTSFTDDRYDPVRATVAACEHMQDLYDIYGNWSLVMAAYNSGAGNVNKAIRRAGGVKSYWAIWPFLPRETRGYVPAFIAVTYVMNYAPEHNIYPVHPGILYNGIDSVTIKDVVSFDQIHEMLQVPMKDLKFLNPRYKKGFIPYTEDKDYILWLPKEYIGEFINNENEIYAYKSTKGIEKDKLLAEIKKAKERTIHYVRSGENLGLIAKKYHVYVSQLKAWNNLRGSTIYAGQKLTVYPSAPYSRSVSYAKPSAKATNGVHIVKSGESLGLIANKYRCTISDLKSWNNLKRNTIYPNQKLKVVKPAVAVVSDKNVKYIYHTVKKGDTLWDIAQEYDGVTVTQIKQLNNISNSKRLKPGQKLKVAVKSS